MRDAPDMKPLMRGWDSMRMTKPRRKRPIAAKASVCKEGAQLMRKGNVISANAKMR